MANADNTDSTHTTTTTTNTSGGAGMGFIISALVVAGGVSSDNGDVSIIIEGAVSGEGN